MSNPVLAKVLALIEPACVHAGLELVDVRFVMEYGSSVLRVCVDRPQAGELVTDAAPDEIERVDLSAIEAMSRELSALLDVNDIIPHAYALEVSSPGIERPLRTAAHFARYAGAEVKIVLETPIIQANGIDRRNFRGLLHGIAGEPPNQRVLVDVDGQRFELPLAGIDSAKIVPDWDAVMQGRLGVRPAPPAGTDRRPSKQPKPGKAKGPTGPRGGDSTPGA